MRKLSPLGIGFTDLQAHLIRPYAIVEEELTDASLVYTFDVRLEKIFGISTLSFSGNGENTITAEIVEGGVTLYKSRTRHGTDFSPTAPIPLNLAEGCTITISGTGPKTLNVYGILVKKPDRQIGRSQSIPI